MIGRLVGPVLFGFFLSCVSLWSWAATAAHRLFLFSLIVGHGPDHPLPARTTTILAINRNIGAFHGRLLRLHEGAGSRDIRTQGPDSLDDLPDELLVAAPRRLDFMAIYSIMPRVSQRWRYRTARTVVALRDTTGQGLNRPEGEIVSLCPRAGVPAPPPGPAPMRSARAPVPPRSRGSHRRWATNTTGTPPWPPYAQRIFLASRCSAPPRPRSRINAMKRWPGTVASTRSPGCLSMRASTRGIRIFSRWSHSMATSRASSGPTSRAPRGTKRLPSRRHGAGTSTAWPTPAITAAVGTSRGLPTGAFTWPQGVPRLRRSSRRRAPPQRTVGCRVRYSRICRDAGRPFFYVVLLCVAGVVRLVGGAPRY